MKFILNSGIPLNKILMVLSASALMCLSFNDTFAALPPIPAGQGLDAQAERFRQEYSIEKREREQKVAKALIEYEEKEKASSAPGVTFVLHSISITGTTVFNTQNLSFIWKPYLNKKVNFNDLNNILKLIKRVYRDMGYLTTTAFLPPQDINNGDVVIRVVEGKRGNLNVEGNKYFSTPSIQKYFHTYRGEVLDMGDLERDVMRLNGSKDLNVTSVLSPGENPETVDVTLKAQENPPYHVSIGTDNQGSRLTGRYRRIVSLDDSNLTGNMDNLAINTTYTDLSNGEYLSYQTPVGTHGTKLGLDAGYFQGKLGQEYKPLDIVNYTEFYNPNASFELYESQDSQVNFRTGIKVEHVNKKQGPDLVTDENLRLPYLAIDAIETDSLGQTSFSPELSFSAPGFFDGSRSNNLLASRPDADAFYTKYDQYVSRNLNMPWGSYIQIRSQFQTATHTLPTSEQIQIGGENSVRGYPEGDFLADVGGYMDTDWYFPMYLIPKSWYFYGTSLRNDIEPLIFYDMGGGKLIQTFSGETEERFLSGIGAGIRIRIKGNMYLKLEWAVPTGDKPIHGTGPSTFDVSFQAGT